ncbi:phytoene/squalene synthase family protein [Phytohabitans houttuyneae]|uniref:Phytoene synthase n=1 Tax=Phytohabitans houttuyneae TaxID=1076126 RepID=A0A6V8KFT3_9ACTN|nr:phytoene/squalene synthase family protein [Phytohabitans houttuyneae]GFJ80929.1 phytoene synthase [Phytohabitans houttuyneae]
MTGDLERSYRHCRMLHRVHGRTYYLATMLLPAWKRRHVSALYGFTRHTDDIVDHLGEESRVDRALRLRRWSERFTAALDGGRTGDDPVLPAVLHTIGVFGLEREDFVAFLRSMTMDLTVTGYDTYDDLLEYMEGSAAAIGSMMLPILGAADPAAAREPARQLGLAFQLTNFIRDVGEDLDRGRIYLPRKDLARFGVTRDDLHARRVSPAVRDLLAFEIERARRHYAVAGTGIPLLTPTSRACIRTAHLLYGGILTEVERAGYDVFRRRATVPRRRRLAVAVRSLLARPGRPAPVW